MNTTFVIFSIRNVVHIRLDINNITITILWALISLAAFTPARRALLAQHPDQHLHWFDFHNMAWCGIVALVLMLCTGLYYLHKYLTGIHEEARRRRRLNAIGAQLEGMMREVREAEARRGVLPRRYRLVEVNEN